MNAPTSSEPVGGGGIGYGHICTDTVPELGLVT